MNEITQSLENFQDVDWENWLPIQRATLCFVVRDTEVLLIKKKRGLGKGKINGPGGRIDPGETPLQCAIREVEEELRVTPTELSYSGRLNFQFVDGLALRCHVFRAEDCSGTARETDEAVPMWTPIEQIPFDRMWQDDRLWVPMMLERTLFDGRFLFDDDAMLGHEIETRPEALGLIAGHGNKV
ncbi:MAG: 8-oxo-dGTP diphosphatase [Gammaproteobacteria bacterium]|nr:8-oxo-dGTP diphosphatase [Gammaproteobacteria bacterium]